MIKVHDVYAKEVSTKAELAYFELSDVQDAYVNSRSTGVKESAILLTVANESSNHIAATTELSVEDAEKLAKHILSLCKSIKSID